MARTNVKVTKRTHEGGKAVPYLKPLQELERTVLTCLLWEDNFYESGSAQAKRIAELVPQCNVRDVMRLANRARFDFKLRHTPLYLATLAFDCKERPTAQEVCDTIGRADEMGEMLSIYWRKGRRPVPAAMKKGLAKAFLKFDAYQLAKYDRSSAAVRLRDVLFMVHPKPDTPERQKLWDKLTEQTLESPDTWETRLSSGADKNESFTELMQQNKLGGLALLRNLRNMEQSGIDRALIKRSILNMSASRILPFRFIAAAKHAPSLEPELDKAMQKNMAEMPKLPGTTAILVDVSGSMTWASVSKNSDLNRCEAAAALAMLVVGVCEDCKVFTFSTQTCQLPTRAGMALRDAIRSAPNYGGGTYLAKAVKLVNENMKKYDRIIVVTDEQSHDGSAAPLPGTHGYMINVAGYQNSVAFDKWVSITGWSEQTLRFIQEYENYEAQTTD